MGSSSNNSTTLDDLAKLAGVSASTVSRALNDHPSISTRTKQRIWALARERDYPFRRYMPSGPIGSEGSIAIVTPRTHGRPLPLSHPFFLELLASIGEAARDRGCDFTVSHTAPANYDDLVLATTTSRANGVIFLGQSTLHEAFNQLADTEARFAVWGAQLQGQKYCSIGSDNLLGGRRATLHLARLGRKRIVFLGETDPEALQRRAGYLEALKESGLEVDNALIIPVDFELESAEAAVGALVRRRTPFDGVFASSDLIALGAIRALRRAGMSVPEDVSVVGYDDMLLSRLSTPALSTIKQDTYKAGRLLVARVLDAAGDHRPERLSTDLIVRESCGG
ncbi:transcriptional regulator [Caulobacter sp. AP07]|uniref:LacI family DNA-binding transcriptional regulator n=1 Tax=Caulobacter sp. AP07 TaxID=1144304 RepID=UPI00027201D4|nr:substrate-binding domain-containing protein [Caulobacter sp. AP07]EJL27512.1 transcriptional regulator [Caulobacter sp. AP07]